MFISPQNSHKNNAGKRIFLFFHIPRINKSPGLVYIFDKYHRYYPFQLTSKPPDTLTNSISSPASMCPASLNALT